MKVLLFLLLAASLFAQEYDPVEHNERVFKSLAVWGGVSMATGTGMLFHDDKRVRTIGLQNILWGSVNEVIAVVALRRTMPNVRQMSPDEARKRLRRLMFINGLLDIAYVGTGLILYNKLDDDEMWKWRGLGFSIQGGYLLGFDWLNFTFTYSP